MANTLTVIPAGSDPALGDWLDDQGIARPVASGRMPSSAEIRKVLEDLDWPFVEVVHADVWSVSCGERDGGFPPFSDLSLFETSYSFRLGPLFGPFEIVRRLAIACGPQVAVEASGAGTVVIDGGSLYDAFHRQLFGAPAPPDEDRWDPHIES